MCPLQTSPYSYNVICICNNSNRFYIAWFLDSNLNYFQITVCYAGCMKTIIKLIAQLNKYGMNLPFLSSVLSTLLITLVSHATPRCYRVCYTTYWKCDDSTICTLPTTDLCGAQACLITIEQALILHVIRS